MTERPRHDSAYAKTPLLDPCLQSGFISHSTCAPLFALISLPAQTLTSYVLDLMRLLNSSSPLSGHSSLQHACDANARSAVAHIDLRHTTYTCTYDMTFAQYHAW